MTQPNCLISYPRSGNTLARFLIEYITERVVIDFNEGPFPDSATNYLIGNNPEVQPKNPPILRKFHLVDPNRKEKELIKDSKVTLIIRDYYDCIMSHAKRGAAPPQQQVDRYCSLISYYNDSKNKATFIYYEDLINLELQPGCIKKILDCNDIIERPNWQRYLDNIVELNSKSKKAYIKLQNSVTTHDYSQKNSFTQKVKSNLGNTLFDKYLSRYD